MQMKDLSQERDQLKGKVRDLASKVDQLSQAIQESKTTERVMEQRAKQLEVRKTQNAQKEMLVTSVCEKTTNIPLVSFHPQREKQQMEEMLMDVRRNEEEMCQSNKSLLSRLEDVQVKKKTKL